MGAQHLLAEQDGEILQLDGFILLRFQCPVCTDAEHHYPTVYFDDAGGKRDGRTFWKRVSGSTVDDITLSPSILCRVPGCELHCWIRDGRIVLC